MNTQHDHARVKEVPAIVHLILKQTAQMRATGEMTQSSFNSELDRIAREELEPHGLALLVRELSDGHTRFIIKDTDTGTVCDMIDCGLRA